MAGESGAGTGLAPGFPQPWEWRNPETGEQLDSETLITDNLKLARKYAWNWARKSGMAYDDLEAVAFVGLVKGCRKFDPRSGYKLSTIAVPYINGEILHHFRDRGYSVKYPSRWRERMPKARRLLEDGCSIAEVCQAVDVEPPELEEMLAAMAGTSELHDELVGHPDAHVEVDVLEPVQQLATYCWERLHSADREALMTFWEPESGRRPSLPRQQLAQFMNAVRMALRGQRLPEVREQLAMELHIEAKAATRNRRVVKRERTRDELQALVEQLGLFNG